MQSKLKEFDLVQIPLDGMSRWSDIQGNIPFSREKWRQLSKQGKAPPMIRLGPRLTFQSNREIHRWLADPIKYEAST
jgi:prophage regulatory protein